MMKGYLLAIAAFLICGACTEVIQTIEPSPVNVTVNPAGTMAEPTTPTEGTGTISLEPAAAEVGVGKSVNIKVIVKDAGGVEVPSENISVNIIDKTILELVEIDGRIIAFGGVAAGVTSVIISASGLQTSIVMTVVP